MAFLDCHTHFSSVLPSSSDVTSGPFWGYDKMGFYLTPGTDWGRMRLDVSGVCMSSSRAKRPASRGLLGFWVCTRPCVRGDGERDTGPGFTQTCCVSLDRLASPLALLKWVEGQPRGMGIGLLGSLLGSFRHLMFTAPWYLSCDSA